MKHASAEALDRLDPLLATLRELPALREKNRGTFYRRSRAFLHFHEDPSGLYADLRLGDDFERTRVTTEVEQERLLARIRAALGAEQPSRGTPRRTV